MCIYFGMGSSRWCKACNSVHENPTGSKCQRRAMEPATTDQEQCQRQSPNMESIDNGETRSVANSHKSVGATSSP